MKKTGLGCGRARFLVKLLPIACIVACLATGDSRAQSVGLFALRGQLVDASTGRPLPDVEMILLHLNWQAAAQPVISGADGRFIFEGLQAGRYILGTLLSGEQVLYREDDSGDAVTVKVGPGGGNENVVFRAAPHPSVSGTVVDEAGEPVPGAYIAAFRSVWRDGRVVFEQQMPAQTDDRGQFRLSALHPGSYYICASWVAFSGSQRLPADPAVGDFASQADRRVYRRSCFPEEPPVSFRIEWAQERRIHLVLESVAVIPVEGHVAHTIPRNTSITLEREDRTASLSGSLDDGGTFKAEAAGAGSYVLWARSEERGGTSTNRWVGRRNIVVERSELKGVEVDMEPAGAIDVFAHSAEGLALKQYSVLLGLTESGGAAPNSYRSENGRDGSILFPSVDPGTYWLTTYTEEPLCIESVRLAGRDVVHGTVSVAPGTTLRLDVNLTTHCGAIDGHVMTGNKPAAFATVWLLVSGSAKSPGQMAHTMSDEDGAFSFDRLPPGRYWLWAWTPENWVFSGPPDLSQVENMASPVAVMRDQRATVNVIEIAGDGGRK